MTEFKEEHIWKVLEAYFKENSIVKNQIDSFNHFINFGLRDIVEQEALLGIPNYTIRFENIYVERPEIVESDRSIKLLYPMDARRRGLDYDATIYSDITEKWIDDNKVQEKIHYRVSIGRIPIMVKSDSCNLKKVKKNDLPSYGECDMDPGGYFIIKGNERVLVSQMRSVYNQVFVSKSRDDKNKYIAESRSISDETGHSVLIQAIINSENNVMFSLPYIKSPIPCGIVFKALGYSDEEIPVFLALQSKDSLEYVRNIVRKSFFCKTKDDALEYMSKYAMHIIPEKSSKDYSLQVVETEILPHMGISGTTVEQACFLGRMVKKLVLFATGERSEDDKDNYTNKRVDTAGSLLYDIFRNVFKKFKQNIKDFIEKKKQKPDIIGILTKNKIIYQGLHKCLATGNWGVQKNATYMKTGVSQILDRMTYMSSISHLRRVIIPVGKEGKNVAMRQIHPSSFGFICPCETPEGGKIGVVLNYALTCEVTCRTSKIACKKILQKIPSILHTDSRKDYDNLTFVFLNGAVIGFSEDPEKTVSDIKLYRKKGLLDTEVSVYYDIIDDDIRIFTDEGRFKRPLFTVSDGKLNITGEEKYKWRKLLSEGIVEYVEAGEIEQSVIAMNTKMLSVQKNNYCEIHPMTMLGIMAVCIPFSDHSQSPRNCYQSSMGKQALGIPVLSYNIRCDTKLYVLTYPQQPIVRTKGAELLKSHNMPSGINAIVAIACYSGFNQEDSVMINLSSIQKGLFCLTSYHNIDCSEKKRDAYTTEQIRLPPENSDGSVKEGSQKYFRRKNANYSLLDSNGIIKLRTNGDTGSCTYVKKGDVLVGKVSIITNKSGEEKLIDDSVIVQPGEEGIVDKIIQTISPNGYKMVKVVIRVYRQPVLGDKFASRSAQKGTLGMVYRQEDMPYTKDGITPDIIINPLCIPSRMTINQLIECVLGKECCFTSTYGDATPFTENSTNIASKITERASDTLRGKGFSPKGWERMYNGMTGEMLEANIFIGPTYYQRLKHMVDDKMHARAKGHLTMLTRQPLEGRSRDGGLRFGEMERDCMIGHGATRFLKERLCDVSDPFQIPVCTHCNLISNNPKQCQICKTDSVYYCTFPYASKLLHQELTSLGLKIKIKPETN